MPSVTHAPEPFPRTLLLTICGAPFTFKITIEDQDSYQYMDVGRDHDHG